MATFEDDFDFGSLTLAASQFTAASPSLATDTLASLCSRSSPRELLFSLASWRASVSSAAPPTLAHFQVLLTCLWHSAQHGQRLPRPLNAACTSEAVATLTQCLQAAHLGPGQAEAWCGALSQASACIAACSHWTAGAPTSPPFLRAGLHYCAALAQAALRLAPSPCEPGSAPTLLQCEAALAGVLAALHISPAALLEEACSSPRLAARSQGSQEEDSEAEEEEGEMEGSVASRAAAAAAAPKPLQPLDLLSPLQLSYLALFFTACHIPRQLTASSAVPPILALQPDSPILPLPAPTSHAVPPLLPAVLPKATTLLWLLTLTQPLATLASDAWSAAAHESTGSAATSTSTSTSTTPSPAPTDAGEALLALLARSLASAAPCSLAWTPLPPPPGTQPTSCSTTPPPQAPPEHPLVLLLGALIQAAAKAPSRALSTTALAATRHLLAALPPAPRLAALATALPACPYPQCTGVVLGWVQGELARTAAGGEERGARLAQVAALIQALLLARLQRGLLLSSGQHSSSSGGGSAECGAGGWGALLACRGVERGSLAEEALALRVSSHLHSEGEVDSSVLCLLRAALLVGGAQAGQAGQAGQAARGALSGEQAQGMLMTYALPLMSGLVAAQGCARSRLGLHDLRPHSQPFRVAGEGGSSGSSGSSSGKAAAVGSSSSSNSSSSELSKALSSHFLLESVLGATIELLEAWVKESRRAAAGQ